MGKLGGTASGAASGAAAGAALGPWGALAGGVLGGALGYANSSDDEGPKMPDIVDPVTGEQLSQAADNTQSGLNQQQAFVDALKAQGGIQNQSNVYNQFQDIAAGKGPNPAQAALNQATGANVANQAALMAGQRGTAANTGMLARQAAMQGGNIQQQAAGQGATMQAQQSLSALGAAGNIAGQQVQNQAGALQNYNQFAQNNQGQLLNARTQYNNQITGAQSDVNKGNLAQQQMNNQQQGAVMNAGGSLLAMQAKGWGKDGMDVSGMSGANTTQGGGKTAMPTPQAPQQLPASNSQGTVASAEGGEIEKPSGSMASRHFAQVKRAFAAGGQVPKAALDMKPVTGPELAAKGALVPGKAKHAGDNYSNDVVPARLSPGEIVLPLSVTKSEDPVAAAARFVAAIMAKKGHSLG